MQSLSLSYLPYSHCIHCILTTVLFKPSRDSGTTVRNGYIACRFVSVHGPSPITDSYHFTLFSPFMSLPYLPIVSDPFSYSSQPDANLVALVSQFISDTLHTPIRIRSRPTLQLICIGFVFIHITAQCKSSHVGGTAIHMDAIHIPICSRATLQLIGNGSVAQLQPVRVTVHSYT